MKYIVFNTASEKTEIGVCFEKEQWYYRDASARRASETLLPEVDRLLDTARLTIRDLDFIACITGPGSFTGIRIGVSTARALSFAGHVPCVGVNYLARLAYNTSADCETVVSLADAGNGKVYLAAYDGKHTELLPTCCIERDTLQAFLEQIDEPFVCCTDGTFPNLTVAVCDENSGDALLQAALDAYRRNGTTEYGGLIPLYVRVSQAERELAEREVGR